jgi:hypothetical protein
MHVKMTCCLSLCSHDRLLSLHRLRGRQVLGFDIADELRFLHQLRRRHVLVGWSCKLHQLRGRRVPVDCRC